MCNSEISKYASSLVYNSGKSGHVIDINPINTWDFPTSPTTLYAFEYK